MDSFKVELRRLWGYFSTWVAIVGAAVVAAWQQLPPDMLPGLQAFIAQNPTMKWLAPIVWLACWVLARAHPQGLTPPPAAADEQKK